MIFGAIFAIAAIVAAVVVAAVVLAAALSSAGDDADENFSDKPVDDTTSKCPVPEKKLVTIQWNTAETWCSEDVVLSGTTLNYGVGDKVQCEVAEAGGASIESFEASVSGNSFSHTWKVLNVLPKKEGGHYKSEMQVDGIGNGGEAKTPTVLKIKFVPNLPKTRYTVGNARFNLAAEDYKAAITENIEYVKGWAASVVMLGAHGTGKGGLLDGKLSWAGYRWMKRVGTTDKFWNGASWENLPSGFTLGDANNFCVGFYKNGTKFTCQYGGDWPETFTDWDIDAAPKQANITKWTGQINTKWTGKFDLKRVECTSSDSKCCRYSVKTTAKFEKKDAFASGMLIIADGDIRSNSGLFFMDDPDAGTFPHEFGHWLGNPDEYAGASGLDTSLNDDGATAGIDPTAIMGVQMNIVKKRHFKTVCKHFADMVKTKTGKTWTYKAVAP